MGNSIASFSYKTSQENVIMEAKKIADKEGKKFSELVMDVLEDYVKKHSDGNPAFTLDQFVDPNFVACPAVFRDAKAWKNYLQKCSDEERNNLVSQIIMIDKIVSKKL